MKKFTPRPYQKLITKWILENPRVAVWSFMGSGKTAATLEALSTLQLFEGGPALVIAPLLVAETVWEDERDKWACFHHLAMSAIVGDVSQRVRAINRQADIYTVNIENLPWLIEHLDGKWPFKTVVFDEASKLKGFRGSEQVSKSGKVYVRRGGTLRSSYLAKLAHTEIKRFIELSGTPASNGLKTLWAPMWFLDAGKRLGRTFTGFSTRWFKQSFDGYSIEPLPHAEKEITERVKDLCFSLVAKDWFDLKEPIIENVMVSLPAKAARVYKNMEEEMYAEINEHGVEAVNTAVKYGKCSQLANGAIYTDDKRTKWEVLHDMKIQALDRIIEEAVGAPIIVVYQFRHDLARLLKAFPQGKELDKKDTRKTIREWNKGKIPVMFLHAASAGHGNNFQDGGNIIVYFGVDWDLELYDQVLERIGPVRQLQSGYDRPVFVYHILAKNTIDEVKLKRLTTKRSVQDLLLEEAAKHRAGVSVGF